MGGRGIYSHSEHVLSIWLLSLDVPILPPSGHCTPPINAFIRKTLDGSYLLPLGGKQRKRPDNLWETPSIGKKIGNTM